MDTIETTDPSKSEGKLKSMQSVDGSLIADKFRALSMMLKNLQGEGGETVLPGPYTKSISTLQFAKTANHTGESTPSASRGLWKSPTSTQTVSNLKDGNHSLILCPLPPANRTPPHRPGLVPTYPR